MNTSGFLQLQSCTAAASWRTRSPSSITICGAGMAHWPPATHCQPGSPSTLTHIRHLINRCRPGQRLPPSDTPKPLKSCLYCSVIQSRRDVTVSMSEVYKTLRQDLTNPKSYHSSNVLFSTSCSPLILMNCL